MSDRRHDDAAERGDPSGSRSPRRELLFCGLGVMAAGLSVTLSGFGEPLGVAGGAASGLGLLVAAVSRLPLVDRLVDREPSTGKGNPQRALALGSAALTALGVVLVAIDVAQEQDRTPGFVTLVCGAAGLVAAGIWTGARAAARWSRPLVIPPPEGRARVFAVAAVAFVLTLQVLLPLRYYLGDDRYDERFSWRMFSAVRVYRCDLQAFDTRGGVEQPVPLVQTIHVGWINLLRRNREAVMERYLRWRCEQPEVEGARLVNRCTSPEGEPVPDVVRAIDCESGELSSPGGAR